MISILVLEGLLTLILAGFVGMDLLQYKKSPPAELTATAEKGGVNWIFILLLQLFFIAIIAKYAMQLYFLTELAAVPLTLLHIWVVQRGKRSGSGGKLYILSKIGGVAVYAYSKFLLLLTLLMMEQARLTRQAGVILFLFFGAVGVYIAVSHIILGARRVHTGGACGIYSDFAALLADPGLKNALVSYFVGALINTASNFNGYPMNVLFRLFGYTLILFFYMRCFNHLKKWQFVRLFMILGLLGSAAGIVAMFINLSPEYYMAMQPSYLAALRVSGCISYLFTLALPVSVLLIKQKITYVKILSGISLVVCPIFLLLELSGAYMPSPINALIDATLLLCIAPLFVWRRKTSRQAELPVNFVP